LKEVLGLLLVAVVVLEAVEEGLRHYIIVSFIRMEEKQAFQPLLGLINLDSNKLP
jgi:hypothetical protein